MVLLLLEYLRDLGFKVPAVFEYFSTRMILAAATSLILCIFLGPYFIHRLYELKIGQPIRTDECPLLGKLHGQKKDTPTMGGMLILFSMLCSMFLWMNWTSVYTLILFITTVSMGLLGAKDDYLKLKYKNSKGLSGRKKLLFQLLLGGGIALYLLYPPLTQSLQMGRWFAPPSAKEVVQANENAEAIKSTTLPTQDYIARIYIPFVKEPIKVTKAWLLPLVGVFIIFVITGSSNGVNLTDGLDGLAAGALIMVAGALGLIAFVSNHINFAYYLNILYIEGSGEIGIYLFALVGACLGFLWYNGHPAQVFMGDTGSLALGAIIGVSAVLLKREILLAVIGGLFVMEALSVILQVAGYRYFDKKRLFLCAPLHHHFEFKGWPETKVVIRFWIVGLLLAIVGIASIKFQ